VSVGIPWYTVPNCSRMEICRGGETAALPPMKPKPTIELGFLCSTYEVARLYSYLRISSMKHPNSALGLQ
jgi:hypothetical protein